MRRINAIKIAQDLLPAQYRQPNRQEWSWLKNISYNNVLEKFYRVFDKAESEALYTNQTMSFEKFLNAKMSEYYDSNSLNDWSGVTWETFTGCYIIDSGATYVAASGTSFAVKLKTVYRRNTSIIGMKFTVKCYVESFDTNVAPYICLVGTSGLKSEYYGLSMGYNEVELTAMADLSANDYLHVAWLVDVNFGHNFKITDIIVGRSHEDITVLNVPIDNYTMYTYTQDYLDKNPLQEPDYTTANWVGLTGVTTSGVSYYCATSTVVTGATATLAITKSASNSGFTRMHTDIVLQDYSTPCNVQIVVSDIFATGTDKYLTIYPCSTTGVAYASGQTLDCRFSNQIFEFDVSAYSLQTVYYRIDYPVTLSSFSAKFSVMNDSQIKYISNISTESNGFNVYIPAYNYNAEIANYLLKAIESKRPVGKSVNIKYY
jgi:hypothetical protein